MYVFWFDGNRACLVIIILVYVCTCCDAADVDCLAQCGIFQYGVPIGRHLLSIKRYQCHTITLQWYALCNGMCGGNIRKYSHENRRKNIVLHGVYCPLCFYCVVQNKPPFGLGNAFSSLSPRVLAHRAVFCDGFIWKFYFFADQNRAHNHPMPVHKNSQLPRRTNIMSFLARLFWRASHAGAKIIANTIATDATYFIANKISNDIIIFLFIYHTLRRRPVLLGCAAAGYISPCDLCAT